MYVATCSRALAALPFCHIGCVILELYTTGIAQVKLSTEPDRWRYKCIQINEEFLGLKGTSKDCRNRVGNKLGYRYAWHCPLVSLPHFMSSGCVLKCWDTPTSQVTIWSIYPFLSLQCICIADFKHNNCGNKRGIIIHNDLWTLFYAGLKVITIIPHVWRRAWRQGWAASMYFS